MPWYLHTFVISCAEVTFSICYRTPTADLILDELIYNDETLSPFFQVNIPDRSFLLFMFCLLNYFIDHCLYYQVFNQPKATLDIILQYFAKYMSKVHLACFILV